MSDELEPEEMMEERESKELEEPPAGALSGDDRGDS